MPRLAVQSHTLRTLSVDLETKLDRIADAGYEGVQFTPNLGGTTPAELTDHLEARDLAVAGCHIKRHQLEDAYEDTIATYRDLPCEDLVVASYGRDGFEDESSAEAAGTALGELGQRCADDGFALHYHNHSYEFTPLDEGTTFDVFADAGGVHLGLEIDTGLAYRGGADPAALIDRYADRVDLIHVTDTIPGDDSTAHTELRDGEVDLAACFDASVAANVTWLIYENGRAKNPFDSIEAAADVMTDLL